MAGAITAFVFASLAATVMVGDAAEPGDPAYDYVVNHFPGNPLTFLIDHPLVGAACYVLVAGATTFAVFRRKTPTILLLLTTAAVPWLPGLAFLGSIPLPQ